MRVSRTVSSSSRKRRNLIICKAFRERVRVSRTVSRVSVVVRMNLIICKAFRGSRTVNRTVSRVAVVVREGI